MEYYSDSELLETLETDPKKLVDIIKQFQKEDAEKNAKELYFNDEEITQDEELVDDGEEYL